MKQYGLKITRKDGSKLEVYYQSLSYIDWSVYSSTEEMFEPSTIRYLIGTYVNRVLVNGEEVNPGVIFEEDVATLQQIVHNLFEKSIFSEEDKFNKMLGTLEKRSRTLMGCYDLFIFLKLPDYYLQMLEQDAYTRAQIIMMLEQSTGINVKERFEHAVHNNVPLDLISDPDSYKKNIRRHGGPVPANPHRMNPLHQHQQTMEQMKPATQQDMPSNVDAMLSESRNALAQALHAGRKKPQQKPAFNWQNDEANFSNIEQE